ncbi:MAG: hypothetical protein WCW31_05035 [Patescibacteria group bacterium]
MQSIISLGKRLSVFLFVVGAFLGHSAMAATVPGIGLPGPVSKTNLEISELRITYRFDQQNSQGKAQQSIPVQMTFRVHNAGKAETAKIAIPVGAVDGRWAELAAIYLNGKELPLQKLAATPLPDADGMRAATFNLTVLDNSDAIVDIRLNQPQNASGYAFKMGTGANWNGNLTGSLEALFPYNAQNWNTVLRKTSNDEMVPLAYSGHSATWNFSNIKPSAEIDAYWLLADPASMDYFDRGTQLYAEERGSLESYEMMLSALLDMEPCNGMRMPMAPWWTNTYQTVATGIVSVQPDESAQLYKSLELWSANWTVANGQEKTCIEMRQDPERYLVALKKILAMPQDQRSSELQNALELHAKFLKNLSSTLGNNSLESVTSTQGLLSALASNKASSQDRTILAPWDNRFAEPVASNNSAPSSVSSPFKLSRTWQIVIYSLLALLVLIGVAIIATRWKEEDPRTSYDVPRTTSDTTPENNLFMKIKPDEKKDFQSLMTPWQRTDTEPQIQDQGSVARKEKALSTDVGQEEHKNELPTDGTDNQNLIKPQTPEPKKNIEDEFRF